jgi:SAM-dependent methyltransferase
MSLVDKILSQPLAYRMWQVPFAAPKLVPVNAHNDLKSVRRVLDVGCGPGTNAPAFAHTDYLGVDLNPKYIESARQRHPGMKFDVADVRHAESLPVGSGFDFIFVNSLLHHIDLASTRALLASLPVLLSPDGHVHVIEMCMPEEHFNLCRFLANADRGNYYRPLGDWKEIFLEHFDPVVFEPFSQRHLGVTLYEMCYFKGKAKAGAARDDGKGKPASTPTATASA